MHTKPNGCWSEGLPQKPCFHPEMQDQSVCRDVAGGDGALVAVDDQGRRSAFSLLQLKRQWKNSVSAQKQAAIEKQAERQAAIERLLQDAELQVVTHDVDVAFLLDATYSMKDILQAVKSQVLAIARSLTEICGGYDQEIRYSCVVYRDYSSEPHVEVLDFTTDILKLEKFLAGVSSCCGEDYCEDVFSGLEAVGQLSWRGVKESTKALFHMADSPCHGRRYHNLSQNPLNDTWPDGDKYGRDLSRLLYTLRIIKGIHRYHFCHLTTHTLKMIDQFRLSAGIDGRQWITDTVLESKSHLITAEVSKMVAGSLAVSRSPAHVPKACSSVVMRQYTIDPASPTHLPWTLPLALKGKCFIYLPPHDVAELLHLLDIKKELEMGVKGRCTVQVALNPFSDGGALRLPYHARLQWTPKVLPGGTPQALPSRSFWVAKKMRSSAKNDNTVEAYRSQMEVQTVAAFLADGFNSATQKNAKGEQVADLVYNEVMTFVEKQPRFSLGASSQVFNLEPCVRDHQIYKFNNNSGYVNTSQQASAVQAFSHWTYEETAGKLMVVDIQGVYDSQTRRFILIDPAIHCPSDLLRFGITNLGLKGVERFFATHTCNDVCQALGLKKHPKQKK